jgi:hypothetical protein
MVLEFTDEIKQYLLQIHFFDKLSIMKHSKTIKKHSEDIQILLQLHSIRNISSIYNRLNEIQKFVGHCNHIPFLKPSQLKQKTRLLS